MRAFVGTAHAAWTRVWHLVPITVLLIGVVAVALVAPGHRARASSSTRPAAPSPPTTATPAITLPGLPPSVHGLQPVPLPGGRTVLLHLPIDFDRGTHPLIFALPGLFISPSHFETTSGFDALANRQGYIVAYGAGLGDSWNAGTGCCGFAAHAHPDDVRYLVDALSAIRSHFHIDANRVVLTGFSNGGMLAFRAACERPHLFRAVLTVSGPLVSRCSVPINVIHVHGLADREVPVAGGYSRETHTWFPDSRTEPRRLPRGSSERLVLWRGGHDWPTPEEGVDLDRLVVQLVG